MKKFLSVLFLFFVIQSCDDKKTQQFGGVNLTIKKQEYSNDSKVQPDIDVDIKLDQEDSSVVCSMLQRYGYVITSQVNSAIMELDLSNRANELIRYLNI